MCACIAFVDVNGDLLRADLIFSKRRRPNRNLSKTKLTTNGNEQSRMKTVV